MLTGSFAWSFVSVTLPFHIQRVSTLDEASTLRWTGWILGVSPLATVITAPFWGRLADRRNPKTLYVMTETLQGLGFIGMALARSVIELFLARLALGVMGAASTFAFMMVRGADVRRQVAWIQSAMTIGQVFGPLLGAMTAAGLGFRGSFLFGAAVLASCALLVRWGGPTPSAVAPVAREARSTPWRAVGAVCAIVLGGSTHVLFLPAVLPQILPRLGVAPPDVLIAAGFVIFVSGVAAALGALAAPRVALLASERVVTALLLTASSVLMALLTLAPSVPVFALLRFLQVLCIAPVFPIVVARVAQHAGGEAIGFLNSARIGAGFIGPIVATTVVAWSSPWTCYLVLAAIGLACVPFAGVGRRRGGEARP
jgi:MFS family permease